MTGLPDRSIGAGLAQGQPPAEPGSPPPPVKGHHDVNSLGLLTILTVIAVAWTLRASYLDAARQRRRADRLATECRDLRAERERLLDELDAHVEYLASARRHPSNVRVLRSVGK